MSYYHWLTRKQLWIVAGQNRTRLTFPNPNRNSGRKKAELERCHIAVEGERCQNLTSRPQSRGDT